MFAGEGDAFRPTGASSCSRPGMPAKRLSTAFDSVTLYGNDPATRARHLRQGRQLGRLDRDARRHEGALLGLRPDRPGDRVSMTINGPAPTILAMFMNTAIDQKLDAFRDRQRPRADRRRGRRSIAAWVEGERARHRAGRHPEGRPGPEHLHLLDRVLAQGDGRHRRVLRRPQGAQLLLGVASPAITSPRRAPTRSASSRSRSRTASRSSRPTWRAA